MKSPYAKFPSLCWLLLLLPLMASGCATGTSAFAPAPKVGPDEALVSIYFSTTGASSQAIAFTISDVALLVGDLWIELPAGSVRVVREEVQGEQLLLGLGAFPAGDCRRVRFRLSQIRIAGDEGGAGLEERQVDLPFARPVALAGGVSTCLFVDWHLVQPLTGEERFAPSFSVRGQQMPLGGDLAYVVCDDIDTLYLVRTDRNFVVAALRVPGPLGELRLDADNRRFYVLSVGDRAIHVFDSANTQFVDRISLPTTVSPRHMALSENGAFAFVSDAATNQVLKVDLTNRLLARQASVGFRPERVIFFEDGSGRLAVSSPTSQRVSILNADTLDILREIPAGLEADSLLFFNDRLYVGERGSNTVSVFDHRSGRQQTRIAVGVAPSFMLADAERKLFVSNNGEASLSLLVAGQNAMARRIFVGPSPYALALSERRQLLYVANRAARALTVMDLAGERIKAVVPLGGSPFSIAVLD